MSFGDRFKDAVAAIVAELIPNRAFFAPVEYTITKAEGGKFSARPTSKRYPSITDAPIRGLFACNLASKLTAGSSVLVAFIEGDPSRPILQDVLAAPSEIALLCTGNVLWDVTGDVRYGVGGIFKVNGGGSFVARSDYTDARFAQMQAAFDAHVHPTGVGPSGPPATPIVSFASVACTKIKTD